MNPEGKQATYFGMNQKLKVVERGPVSLGRALEVVDEYILKLKPKYASDEEAIAETLFGFAWTRQTFIEIYIDTPSKIRFKFENPSQRKFLFWQYPGIFQRTLVLSSVEQLKEEVTFFFNLSVEDYQRHFIGLR